MPLQNISTSLLLGCALFVAACAKPVLHQAVSTDSLPPLTLAQPGDRNVLAGEWEYEDGEIYGAVDRLTLDKKGKGHYTWKKGRFATHSLIGRTWRGKWFQKENDRDGGFMVELSTDFSEGEGRWWYSRIGTDHAPSEKGGTFHLTKKTARRVVRP